MQWSDWFYWVWVALGIFGWVWPLWISEKTIPNWLREKGFKMNPRFIPIWTWAIGTVVLAGLLIMRQFSDVDELGELRAEVKQLSQAPIQPIGADQEFRDDLQTFLNARALPAYQLAEDFLNQVKNIVDDSNMRVLLNNHLHVEAQRRRNDVLKALTNERKTNEEILETTCRFFGIYQDVVEWTYKLGTKYDGFDFDTPAYRDWLRRDQYFEDELVVLVADPRYSDLDRCGNFTAQNRVE